METEFTILGVKGLIRGTCFWSHPRGENGFAFERLGLVDEKKLDYCEKILGYRPTNGMFPWCKSQADVIKLGKQLEIDVIKKESPPKMTYKSGDYYNIGEYSGKICGNPVSGYYWDGTELIFENISLQGHTGKYEIQRIVLGNTLGSGVFPWCGTIEDLVKFCAVLHDLNLQKIGIPTPTPVCKPVEEDLFKVGDWIRITKSGEAWNKDMDKHDGRIVQITKVWKDTWGYYTVDFKDSGSWTWHFRYNHFKKWPGEIEEPPKKTSLIPDIPPNLEFKLGSLKGDFQGSGKRWHWNYHGGSNSTPFNKLGISGPKLQKEILGYSEDGDFPYCHSKEDLYTFCSAINKRLITKTPTLEVADPVKELVRPDSYTIVSEIAKTEKSGRIAPVLIKVCKI